MQSERNAAVVRAAAAAIAVLIVLVVLAVGIVGVTMPGCESCHSSAEFAAGSAESSHVNIDCVRCHVADDPTSRLTFASRVVFGMTLQVASVGGRAGTEIGNARCLECHADVLERVVISKGYRIDHFSCAEDNLCVDCHSNTAHGDAIRWPRISQMDDCLRCHNVAEVSSSCDTCHDTRTRHERLGVGAWATTHGAGWETLHGMGDGSTCTACHPSGYCVRCHGVELPHGPDFMRRHSTVAVEAPDSCEGCHDQESFCDGCHGMAMPHPPGFTRGHSEQVARDGDESCLRCHVRADCVRCHEKHVHPGGSRPPGPPIFQQRQGRR